jgi:CRP-like cAMP-binding protein
MEKVKFKARQVVHPHDKRVKFAVFPCDALVSVMMRSNGKSVEIAMIGSEGFFGVPLLLGVEECPMKAITQVAGQAICISAKNFREIVQAEPTLAVELRRYAQFFTVMLAQSAVCGTAHTVEQRCARWLLMAHDRLTTDEFPLTQELLAEMLGVRRPTVSEVAERMRRQGAIRYRQGKMTILDRGALEDMACPCYEAIRLELSRTVGAG